MKKITVINPKYGEAYDWSPVELAVYEIVRKIGSAWISVADHPDPCVIEAAKKLIVLGLVESRTEAELSHPSQAEILTVAYMLCGAVTPDQLNQAHRLALASARWPDDGVTVRPAVWEIRLASAYAHIEIAIANRHHAAIEAIELIRGDAGSPPVVEVLDIDSWLSAAWFKDTTGTPPDRLRQAARRGSIRTRNRSGTVLYSRTDFQRLWPNDSRW